MKRYPHYIIDLARKLRKEATPAEEILWECLRNRRLSGLKLKHQHHIDRCIVDFAKQSSIQSFNTETGSPLLPSPETGEGLGERVRDTMNQSLSNLTLS